MFDTHVIVRTLTVAGIDPAHTDGLCGKRPITVSTSRLNVLIPSLPPCGLTFTAE